MFKFKSLTTKFIFISFLIFLLIFAYIYASFQFTRHIKDEATRINLAGQLRYRSFEIAWLIHQILEVQAPKLRQPLVSEIKNKIDRFEETTKDIRDGNEELKIRPLENKEALMVIYDINNEWTNSLKPLFLNITELPIDKGMALYEDYGAWVDEYVFEIDKFVGFIEYDYIRKLEEYDRFRFYLIGLFILGTAFVVFYIKRSIVVPVQKLRDVTKEIRKGKFDASIDIKSSDEIGELSQNVNRMAQTLDLVFNEKIRLLKRLEALASFPEKNPYPILECDMDCNITYFNPAAQKLIGEMGIKEMELLPSDVTEIALGLEALNKEVEYREVKFADVIFGEYIHLTQDKKIRIYAFDVTEHKKAEESLRESESSLAKAQRIAHLGNWDWDICNKKLKWSDEIYRIFGLTPHEFEATYEAFLSSVHPDDREFVKESVNKALFEKKPYSIDHRIVMPDGTVRIVHEQAEVTFNESGKAIRMIGTVIDITERKEAEESLLRSEKKFQDIFQFVPESLLAVNKQIEIQTSNKAFKTLIQNYSLKLNMSPDELKEKILSEMRNHFGKTKHGVIEIRKKG